MAAIGPSPSTSALAKTSVTSTEVWQRDLKTLFDNSKERFPDVVWELTSEYDHDRRGGVQEDVWGHKAIVYARAPPSFLAQYFDVRPNGASRIFSTASPLPGDNPTQSTFSLSLQDDRYNSTPSGDDAHSGSPTPSSGPLSLLRLSTEVLPALFSNQLEFLYTGAGIGDAFEFLFDSREEDESMGDAEAMRIDKLRKDLVFMWRSRLYSDVRIELTGPFAPNGDVATAVFSSHRFILASRSHYFRSLFLSSSFAPVASSSPSNPITISLPSPPFTPASLHFTLGYIYSGTLYFSNRTFDLDTAFQIYRSGIYLSLTTLQAEVEARIIEEMMHGLYHAYLTMDEYNKVTGGRWGVGGCHCKTCIRRAPRILEFAMADDVKNSVMERGARRALVGIFGDGWVTPEFAALPVKAKNNAMKGVNARTNIQNLFPLLFAAQAALNKIAGLNSQDKVWGESTQELVLNARNKMDDTLCSNLEESFDQEEWLALLESDGAGFNDVDQVNWIMESIHRGLNDSNAPMVYQVLVNSVLLRSQTDPVTGVATTLLSSTSPIRARVEQARIDIVKWLRKRWLNVRQGNAFEPLEDWALKEISDELEVPVDELLAAPPTALSPQKRNTTSRSDSTGTLRTARDVESIAAPSLRASVLNRNAARIDVEDTRPPRDPLASSRSSIASSVTSVRTASRPAAPSITSTRSPARLPPRQSAGGSPATAPKRPTVSTASSSTADPEARSPPAGRPKSLAPSVSSVRSTAASVKSTASNSTLRRAHLNQPTTKPLSPRSPLSDSTTTSFKTAPSHVPTPTSRVRTTSSLSNVSSTSLASSIGPHSTGPGLSVPIKERERRMSATSATSVRSAASARSRVGGAKSPAAGRVSISTPRGISGARKPASTTSTRSVSNGKPVASKIPPSPKLPKGVAATLKQRSKAPAVPASERVPDPSQPDEPPTPAEALAAAAAATKPPTSSAHIGHASQPSDSSSSTVRMVPILSRKASSDTITKSMTGSGSTHTPRASRLFTPRSSVSLDSDAPPPPIEKDRPTSPSPLKKVVLATADLNTSTIDNLNVPSPKPSRMSVKSKASKRAADQTLSPSTTLASLPPNIRGVTLQIGIPCMISSKRSRFKAFARYIGEVAGEEGPWVGVEVPVSEGWSADRLDGRDWNDGSYGGVKYFEIGSNASNSAANSMVLEEGEERAARRRRVDAVLSASFGGSSANADTMSLSSLASSNRRKREGDALLVEQERLKRLRSVSPAVSEASSMESRGLFVRPTQVLLVMDAPEHR